MNELLVLGHKGMLGQMVMKYFGGKGYKLHTNKYRFNESEREDFIAECRKYPQAIVVNCIGKIKQKTDDANDLLWANALLPLALNNHLLPEQTLVHPSTDCVFDGKKGSPYGINDTPDAADAYGWSKRLGEVAVKDRSNTMIMRVSIIGPDENPQGKGLLAWFLSNPSGSELKGFTNHLWNGITTLEWCKQLENFIEKMEPDKSYFYQLGTEEYYSKHQMLKFFQHYLQTDYQIEAFEASESIDRRLQPTVLAKSLENQLEELSRFSLSK
ncbi:MAG: sugar nucleotide-binding protein [Vicingaceae bacterium]